MKTFFLCMVAIGVYVFVPMHITPAFTDASLYPPGVFEKNVGSPNR